MTNVQTWCSPIQNHFPIHNVMPNTVPFSGPMQTSPSPSPSPSPVSPISPMKPIFNMNPLNPNDILNASPAMPSIPSMPAMPAMPPMPVIPNANIYQSSPSPNPIPCPPFPIVNPVPMPMLMPDAKQMAKHVENEQRKFDNLYKQVNQKKEKTKKMYHQKLENYINTFNGYHGNKNKEPLNLNETQKIVKQMTGLYDLYDQYELQNTLNYQNNVHRNEKYRAMSENSKLKREVQALRNSIKECQIVLKQLQEEYEEEQAKIEEEGVVVRNKVRYDAMKEAFRIHMDFKKQIRDLELQMVEIHKAEGHITTRPCNK